MRYLWVFQRPVAQFTGGIGLVEEDGLCISNYELPGGWQCQGNGMLTVIRQLLATGYRPTKVVEGR